MEPEMWCWPRTSHLRSLYLPSGGKRPSGVSVRCQTPDLHYTKITLAIVGYEPQIQQVFGQLLSMNSTERTPTTGEQVSCRQADPEQCSYWGESRRWDLPLRAPPRAAARKTLAPQRGRA